MLIDIKYEVGELEVVSLTRAKKQLKIDIDQTDEDDLILSYIDSAIAYCEKFIGGHIIPKTMTLIYDRFSPVVEFEVYPFKSITSVEYYAAETLETLDDAKYALTTQSERVYKLRLKEDAPDTDKRFDAVTITAEVGFENDVIPKPIIQAILLLVSNFYEVREDAPERTTTAAEKLLRAYKKY
jgi:uncharacterized phiE125 gp8 family phage protein